MSPVRVLKLDKPATIVQLLLADKSYVVPLIVSVRALVTGVYPKAPVTSVSSKVIEPVLVLKEDTPDTIDQLLSADKS